MKRKFLSVALCLMAALTMNAQDVDKAKVTGNAEAAAKAGGDLKKLEEGEKAWKFDGTVGLNAAATGLVNWAAGGKNNVNGIVYAKLHLLYHKNALAWETNFDTDFGMTWIDQKEDAFQKSSDNIKLATKLGWEFKKNWYLTVLGSFQSQYALGRMWRDTTISSPNGWLLPTPISLSVLTTSTVTKGLTSPFISLRLPDVFQRPIRARLGMRNIPKRLGSLRILRVLRMIGMMLFISR